MIEYHGWKIHIENKYDGASFTVIKGSLRVSRVGCPTAEDAERLARKVIDLLETARFLE
jgi:hypothetical protein